MTGTKWGKYKSICLITSPSQEMRDRKKDSTDKVASEWVKRREGGKEAKEGWSEEGREGGKKEKKEGQGRQGKRSQGKGREEGEKSKSLGH